MEDIFLLRDLRWRGLDLSLFLSELSFPEDFILVGCDTRQYRAIGNAVPPVLMWHITQGILNAIEKANENI